MILKALTDYIEANVGGSDVYAVAARPNAPAPYVVVELDSTFEDRHFGAGATATGLYYYDFEISCYARTAAAAINLAKSIKNLLRNFQGPMSSTGSPVATYFVSAIEITSESTNYEDDTELYRDSVFITVPHRQS